MTRPGAGPDNISTNKVVMQYSFNGTNWNIISTQEDRVEIDITNKQRVYFKNLGTSLQYKYYDSNYNSDVWGFKGFYFYSDNSDNTFKVGGPLSSLAVMGDYSYSNLFSRDRKLTDASELILPEDTAEGCYEQMFQECISLVNAPALPATTLANKCYSSMFYGCTNLVNAPELPATTLAEDCYNAMFYGCTSLVNIPSILPVTTLA
ncbi:MAG: hypothetical protein II295_08370, partial [Akkermansia sp.]|nr:hypothetical protein [Akkermansia sp.]